MYSLTHTPTLVFMICVSAVPNLQLCPILTSFLPSSASSKSPLMQFLTSYLQVYRFFGPAESEADRKHGTAYTETGTALKPALREITVSLPVRSSRLLQVTERAETLKSFMFACNLTLTFKMHINFQGILIQVTLLCCFCVSSVKTKNYCA
jgi:hypothetical protein